MIFDMLLDLLDSIKQDYFSDENRKHWKHDLEKIGIKGKDGKLFMESISKIMQLKTAVCLAMPRGGFSMRIYSEEEQKRLSPSCRGLLFHFEQAGLLPPELREVVIEQAVRLHEFEFDEDRLRILILFVLFHQTGLDVILSHYQALPHANDALLH